MNLSGNTILITGGTSGIGFELATQLLKIGNTLIVTGRDSGRIDETERRLPGVHVFQRGVSDPAAISLLFDSVVRRFPKLNMLINNAGIMREINLQDKGGDLEDINPEIETNLAGPVRMVKQFLQHLRAQPSATIVNVSSGLAFVPLPTAPIYCAAKAGLHSFTLSLRAQLKHTNIRVFELAPPLTQTSLLSDFNPGEFKRIPILPMDVAQMVALAIDGLRRDQLEICPGHSNTARLMSRIAPRLILNRLSKPVEAMLAHSTPLESPPSP